VPIVLEPLVPRVAEDASDCALPVVERALVPSRDAELLLAIDELDPCSTFFRMK
jgi:hypothetical protein